MRTTCASDYGLLSKSNQGNYETIFRFTREDRASCKVLSLRRVLCSPTLKHILAHANISQENCSYNIVNPINKRESQFYILYFTRNMDKETGTIMQIFYYILACVSPMKLGKLQQVATGDIVLTREYSYLP